MHAFIIGYAHAHTHTHIHKQNLQGILDESGNGGVPAYTVAIKTVREEATAQDVAQMMSEAAMMAQFTNHPNVSNNLLKDFFFFAHIVECKWSP